MVRLMVATLLVLAALPASARSPLHMWTDKDGVLHVDDSPPAAPRRVSPRKAAVKADHWWERRNCNCLRHGVAATSDGPYCN